MLWYAASPPRLSTKASRDGGNESTAEKTPPAIQPWKGFRHRSYARLAASFMVVCLGSEESSARRFKVNSLRKMARGGTRQRARETVEPGDVAAGGVVGALGDEARGVREGAHQEALQPEHTLAASGVAGLRSRGHLLARDVEEHGMVACALRQALDVAAHVRLGGHEGDAEAVEHGEDQSARREEGLRLNGPVGRLDRAEGIHNWLEHRGHRAGGSTTYRARGASRNRVRGGAANVAGAVRKQPVGRISRTRGTTTKIWISRHVTRLSRTRHRLHPRSRELASQPAAPRARSARAPLARLPPPARHQVRALGVVASASPDPARNLSR